MNNLCGLLAAEMSERTILVKMYIDDTMTRRIALIASSIQFAYQRIEESKQYVL